MSSDNDSRTRQGMPAVRTTIVGGRPPGCGQGLGEIPRGIEVLVKKASVDPEFAELLLAERSGAAKSIGLELDPAEVLMIDTVAAAQLKAIIARTKVGPRVRTAFLGRAAAVMLAALGVAVIGCDRTPPPSHGIRPEPPAGQETVVQVPAQEAPAVDEEPPPDEPDPPLPPVVRGTRPDRPGVSKGIRPDQP